MLRLCYKLSHFTITKSGFLSLCIYPILRLTLLFPVFKLSFLRIFESKVIAPVIFMTLTSAFHTNYAKFLHGYFRRTQRIWHLDLSGHGVRNGSLLYQNNMNLELL